MILSHKIQFILAAVDEKLLVNELLSNFVDGSIIYYKYSTSKWENNIWSKDMVFVTNFLRNYTAPNFDTNAYVKKLNFNPNDYIQPGLTE